MDLQDPVEKPHSKNLRLHRQMQSPGTFLVTKCVEPRQRVIGPKGCFGNLLVALLLF